MSTRPQISVATVPTSAQAEVLCQRLSSRQIEATIAPPAAPAGTGVVPVQTGYSVRVAEADFGRAMAVLFPIPELKPTAVSETGDVPSYSATGYVCENCGERLVAGMENCWSCGTPKGTAPKAPSNGQPVIEAPEVWHLPAAGPDLDRRWTIGPAASLTLPAPAPRRRRPVDASTIARRAWLTAAIGLLLAFLVVPLVLNLYSLGLVVHLARGNERLTAASQLRFYGALVANAAALVWAALVISRL